MVLTLPAVNYEFYLDQIKMPEITIINLISWIAAGAMIFGGVVPFIPQCLDIWRTRNAEGFSTFVCLTLLIANLLRILFWFGKHFELPLLAQSIIMLFMMMFMVHLCVSVKKSNEIISSKARYFMENGEIHLSSESSHHPHSDSVHTDDKLVNVPRRTFFDFDPAYFWKWTDFLSYVEFMVTFGLLIGTLTYLLLDNRIYIEILGFMAVFTEAMLGTPQFYRNFQNKSTVGMSKKMVCFWTMGDIFKTGYFILRHAPAQFWICGMLQVSIDISIFIQVYIYRKSPPGKVVKSAQS